MYNVYSTSSHRFVFISYDICKQNWKFCVLFCLSTRNFYRHIHDLGNVLGVYETIMEKKKKKFSCRNGHTIEPCDYLFDFNDNKFFVFVSFLSILRPIQISMEKKYSIFASQINFSCHRYHFLYRFIWAKLMDSKENVTGEIVFFFSFPLCSFVLFKNFNMRSSPFFFLPSVGCLMNVQLWFYILWLKNQKLNNV